MDRISGLSPISERISSADAMDGGGYCRAPSSPTSLIGYIVGKPDKHEITKSKECFDQVLYQRLRDADTAGNHDKAAVCESKTPQDDDLLRPGAAVFDSGLPRNHAIAFSTIPTSNSQFIGDATRGDTSLAAGSTTEDNFRNHHHPAEALRSYVETSGSTRDMLTPATLPIAVSGHGTESDHELCNEENRKGLLLRHIRHSIQTFLLSKSYRK